MGALGNSFKRELGKNTGKFVSNILFGDSHSTPYRRVGNLSFNKVSEERVAATESQRYLSESKAQAAMTIAEAKVQEVNERIMRERKNQLYAIDSAVLHNIDLLNSRIIPTDKQQLLQMQSELSVQLKANQWQTKGDEAKIRNKYPAALLEKFEHCIQELEIVDSDDPHLKYYKNLLSRNKRIVFWKKNKAWIFPLLIPIGLLIIFLFVAYSQLLYICLMAMILTVLFYLILKKNKVEKGKQTQGCSHATENLDIKPSNQDERSVIHKAIPADKKSVFFDLNLNGRIEQELTHIWNKYQRLVDQQIMQRRPIFSADGVKDSILFVGVNPSYNPDDDKDFIPSSDHNSLMYGSFYQRNDAPDYFKKLEEFTYNVGGKGYTHINLLYARENDRDALLRCNSDFIREQLELTYDTIVIIRPIAIVFFSDYCKHLIFGVDRWVDPITKNNGHYILKGTNIPVFFSDDITILNDSTRATLLNRIKSII